MRSSAPVVRSILRSAVAPQRAGLTGLALSKSNLTTAMLNNNNNGSSRITSTMPTSTRSFSSSTQAKAEFESPFGVNSLAKLTEEEEMLRDSVRRFAEEVIQPRVEAMDEAEKMDSDRWIGGLIGDDHVPFLARGVEVLHLIPSPFPEVWHQITDDGEHLDMDVVEDWAVLTTAFAAEWMDLEGFMIHDGKEAAKRRRNEQIISKTEL